MSKINILNRIYYIADSAAFFTLTEGISTILDKYIMYKGSIGQKSS